MLGFSKLPAFVVIIFLVGAALPSILGDEFEMPHHQHFTRETFPDADRQVWCIKITDEANREAKIRDFAAKHNLVYVGKVGTLDEYHLLEHLPDLTNNPRDGHEVHKGLQEDEEIEWMQFQVPRQHERRSLANMNRDVPALPDDPDFRNQWHIKSSTGIDLNVYGAWENRIFGEGVGISIVDDGLEWRHPDFVDANGKSRYNSSASHDWNGPDGDPSPADDGDHHGTQCGGLAFGGAFNGKCGAGIAYKATFSGQRLISRATTDAMEASALTLAYDTNHIYSCSWGPPDDGQRLEGPGPLTRQAIKKGIESGRGGKGSIFIWAGGNGHTRGDNVNYDGYANSIYTIAVAAVDNHGKKAPYSEEGAPLIASGVSSPPGIHTTAIRGQCSSQFSGTSATAPMIAGVVALILNANRNLTWRDMQNILIKTARKNDATDGGWALNGARRWVNHKYGYGLIDTTAAVNMALTYTLLPPARVPVSATFIARPDLDIPDEINKPIYTNVRIEENFYVEHVELTLRAVHTRRGDLQVELMSPSGTTSILSIGGHPDGRENFQNWKFTSVRDTREFFVYSL